ncbi:helix-turn-helix domain-containing protein [Streptomyces sp. NBC_01224]|uniref:helix-turn-helix domain-containing protein n=1 Tax=Streptomyces sp. NBC_01224 TaxID=2903783 RepID=UPI002E0E9BEC|nr:helix-turn-helix domain-containing protein [Streptomyces sp. NBC_01224]
MPNAPLVPTVRRRRLGATLRRMRNQAGLTLDEAAASMGWKGPKLSKIENATLGIRPNDLHSLLDVYSITDPEARAALDSLSRDAGKRGWWQTYAGILSPSYADFISLESDAEKICSWSPLLIPGLLQTPSYARETISGITTTRSPEEVAALAEVRMARQSVLTRPSPPMELWTIIHEAALHQRFAARPTTMREQLRRLLDASEMPNVTVQLMPMAPTAHPGLLGGFSLATFAQPLPEVVVLENLSGAAYVEGEDIAPYALAFQHIQATALSVEDSLVRIAEMEEGLRK